MHRHYNTNSRRKTTVIPAMILLAAVLAAGYIAARAEAPRKPDVTYPMANQRIEWTWAGKGGR